ncbi:MAG: stalk domain-containing protein [Caldisericia bacterium]|nr:stalk domain-containing protein [Caldisericia bacterium]
MKKGIAFIVAFVLALSQFGFYTAVNAIHAIDVLVVNQSGTDDVATGEISEYTIDFTLDEDVALDDVIKIKFPTGTSFVNATIDKSNVFVDGTNPTKDATASGTILSIHTPAAYSAGDIISINLPIEAGVKNPSTQSGKYKLQVGTFLGPNGTTTIENYDQYSNNYYIGHRSEVTISPSVDPNYNTAGVKNIKEFVTWTIKWKTGNQGHLTAGSDTITLDFTGNTNTFPKPDGCFDNGSGVYFIPATYIQINSKTLKSSATATLSGVAPNQTLDTITFTIPNTLSDISANATVTIILTNQVGMFNPPAGDYTIKVNSSRETTPISSQTIAVNDAVSFYDLDAVKAGVQGVVVDPPTTSTVASFQMGIINDIPLSVGVGTITFAMPMTMTGVRNPPITAVQFEHSIDAGVTWVETTLKTAPIFTGSNVVVTVPLDIPANSPIRVTLTKDLNIKTPTTAGAYSVQAMTSAQPYYRNSPTFAIGTGVSGVKVIPSPATDDSENVQYVVECKLGQSGALYKSTGKIFVELFLGNDPLTFDGITLSNGSVFLGTGQYTTIPTEVESLGAGIFKFTVSPPQDLNAGASVKITFKPSAGFVNPIAGTYKGIVYTTSEMLESESESYEIQDAIMVDAIDVDPTAAGVDAEYTITVSIDDNLTKNIDTISVAFPQGQRLPTTITPGDISVDGVDVILSPKVSSNVLTFHVPIDILAGPTFDIVLKKSAKIKNPTTAGIYRLQVNTSKQIAYRLSPPFNIGTSVTGIEVIPSPDTANSANVQYTVKFKIGTNGALTANSGDFISIQLPLGELPTAGASSITVNNDRCIENPTITDLGGGLYDLEVYPPKDLRSGSLVTVVFTTSAGLKNPTEGNYRITVFTNKEPIPMQSDIYLIKNAVVIHSVDVEPPATGAEAEYTISIDIGKKLTKDIDTITISFPRESRIPTSINKGSISIENDGVVRDLTLPPTVSSTSITLKVPVTYDPTLPGADPTLIIVVKQSAKVQNPSTAGIYTLQILTSSQPYYRVSPNYAIGTAVTDFKITPNPKSKNTVDVQYNYEFKVGASGGLTKNADEIHIIQKVGTAAPLPMLLPTSSVTVNGKYTQVATEIIEPTSPLYPPAAGWVEIILQVPEDIRNSGTVKIVIMSSAGLINPTAGNYKGVIWTDQEPIAVESEYYQIEDTILFLGPVIVTPPSVGQIAEYEVSLHLDLGLQANQGTITLAFPSGTKVNRTIPTTGITIQIGAGPEQNLNIAPQISGTNITITTPSNIPDATDIVLRFKKNAGVTNPTTAGLYRLQAMTSSQPYYALSEYYAIGSSITVFEVTPMPNNIGGERVVYVVKMKIGANGLIANEDQIFLSLPLGAPAGAGTLQPSTITVNGEFTTLSTNYQIDPTYGPPYIQFEIPTPVDVKANAELTVVFLESCALTNPLTEGIKFGYAHTSQEDIEIKSNLYNIVDSVAFPGINPPLDMRSVIPKSNGISLSAQYMVHFVTSPTKPQLTQNLDRIHIVFPDGTTVPSSISPGSIYISTAPIWGPGDPDSLTCPPPVGTILNQSVTITGQEVSFPVPFTVAPGSNVYILFCKDAGLKNPSKPQIYNLLVKTSTQPNYGISRNYIIRSTITPPEVFPDPPVINQNAEYTVQFTLGESGAITANNDDLFIGFNGDDYLTPVGNLAPSSVKVNGVYCTTYSIVTAGPALPGNVDNAPGWNLYRWIRIQSPVHIEKSSQVTIEFLQSAGFTNPAVSNNYTCIAWTNKEPIAIESYQYTIGDAVQSLEVPATHPNPKTTGSFAEYLIEFDLGADPASQLYANTSSISVEFPEGTAVPSYINPANIKIGFGAVCNPTFSSVPPITVEGNTVTFRVPVNIPAGEHVCVKFEKGSQIANPQEPGSYQLKLKTSSQPIAAISNYYSILSTSSIPRVSAAPPAINAKNVAYEIRFNTGINGNMLKDTEDIVIVFDPAYIGDYTVGFDPNPSPYPALTTSIPQNSVYINGIVLSSIPTVVNDAGELKYIKLITPVDISAESEVVVQITNIAGIKNPPTVGLYRLAVLTSVEPTPVESHAFSLFSSVGAITVELAKDGFVEPAFPPAPDPRGATPNTNAEYIIHFSTGPSGNLVKDLGAITIAFPYDTKLPSSILPGSVRCKITNTILGVTFDGTLSQAPVVNQETNEIVIRVPDDVEATDTVEIRFTELANIKNPTQSGTYSLEVSTSSEPLLVRSDPYSILGLSAADVSVEPCLQQLTGAVVSINFTTVNALAIGDTIDIEFPYGTRLPSVIDGDFVTVNNHPANIGAYPQVQVNQQIVSIKVPEVIQALSTVRVVFIEKARIQNPSTGMYSLKIKAGATDPDHRWVHSKDYFICGDFTLYAAEMIPDTLLLGKGQRKQLEVISYDEDGNEIPAAGLSYYWTTQGNAGSLTDITKNKATLVASQTSGSGTVQCAVTFGNTTIQVSASVTVSSTTAQLVINPTSASMSIGDTKTFTAGAYKQDGSPLNLTYSWRLEGESTGTLSPTTGQTTTFTASSAGTSKIIVSATYEGEKLEATANVTVSDNGGPGPGPGDQAPIQATITPTRVNANQGDVNFNFTFTSVADISNGTIEITIPSGFPDPTTAPGSQGYIAALAGTGVNISNPPNIQGRKIIFTVMSMSIRKTFTMSYSKVSAPSTPGEYIFQVQGKQNQDSTLVSVEEPPEVLVVSVADGSGRASINPNQASSGATGQRFEISYTADAPMDSGAVQIIVPQGFSRPSLSPTAEGYVRLKEDSLDFANSPEVLGNIITVPIMSMGVNDKLTIIYENVRIPAQPNVYTFVVKSKGMGGSFVEIPSSPSVNVSNTRISDAKVEVDPNQTSMPAEYTISFRTSGTGSLLSGKGTIEFIYPAQTILPDSIKSSNITVNGEVVTLPPNVESVRSKITITVPKDIPSNTLVIVKFSIEANIVNPAKPGDEYKISITTSSDTIQTSTDPYTIVVSELRNIKVEVSPIQPAAIAEYTIRMKVGGAGALSVNQDSITVIFPSDTELPSSIPANAILINSTPLMTRPQVDLAQRKIIMALPVRIENDTDVNIEIKTAAMIKNPTRDGMYKLKVFTSKETKQTESEAYQIGTSLLGDIRVSLSSPLVDEQDVTYTVQFRTGGYGRIEVGETITVTFDSRYNLGTIQSHHVTVNGVVCSVTPEVSEGVSVIIKSPIAIDGESNVTVTISNMRNPSISGEYTVSVSTQAEPMPVVSTPYTVGMILTTEITVNPSSPNGLSGWYKIAPNILFNNDVASAKIFYAWDEEPFQRYTGSAITAPEGIHTLNWYSVAEGFSDESKQDMQFKVDTKAPEVHVSEPKDGAVLNEPQVKVAGEVYENNSFTVTVNDRPATLTEKRFTSIVSLNPGDNLIDIIAIDEAGNRSVTPRIRVKYVQPSDIKFNIQSPQSLSSVYPILEKVDDERRLIATIPIQGKINPSTADTVNIIIMDLMDKPVTLPIDTEGVFKGDVKMPVIAGLNGIVFSVKDRITGKEYSSSATVIAKVMIELQIGNSLAFINEQENKLDAPPYIKDGRTMLPMRFIGEAIGATVGWIPDSKTVVYDFDTIHIELQIGSTESLVKRGETSEKIVMDVAPEIKNGRTFVPLRFVTETLGAEVEWIPETKTIKVSK